MLVLGNDIIDRLEAPEGPHPRFASRVLSLDEQQDYQKTDDKILWLWRAWSAKEASYKSIKRHAPDTIFSPSRFTLEPSGKQLTFEQWKLQLAFIETPDYVHCTAFMQGIKPQVNIAEIDSLIEDMQALKRLFSPEEWQTLQNKPLPSLAVRSLAKQALSCMLSAPPEEIGIYLIGDKIPIVKLPNHTPNLTLSLSHHGRYVAAAFVLPPQAE